ncbi:hypothetical protein MJO29_002341 [Puccinia striiformis f. sp. tritici]|nr:hypothetical protein MJO29_002341 [Puccinia striiformis f. sp. tritici]
MTILYKISLLVGKSLKDTSPIVREGKHIDMDDMHKINSTRTNIPRTKLKSQPDPTSFISIQLHQNTPRFPSLKSG